LRNLLDPVRVMLFDIESSDLEASFGHTLCFGYKYLGDKQTRVLSLRDFPEPPKEEEPDAHLLVRVNDLLTNRADIIVTYYGKEFDRKFLNTRMLMCGLSPLPPLSHEHVDLYYTARGNLKLHSNRLQAVSESLGCPYSKTPVRADTWRRAQRGDPKSMRYVIDHCRLDVDILEWCYLKLRAFVRQHPRVGLGGSCRACGGTAFQRRGFTITKAGGRAQRLQCQKCGMWDTQKPGVV